MSNQDLDLELVEAGKTALYCLFSDNPAGFDLRLAQSVIAEYDLSQEVLREVAVLLDMPGYEPEDRVRVSR